MQEIIEILRKIKTLRTKKCRNKTLEIVLIDGGESDPIIRRSVGITKYIFRNLTLSNDRKG